MAAMTLGPAREALLSHVEREAEPLVSAGAAAIVPAGALPAVGLQDVHVAGVPFVNGPAGWGPGPGGARAPPPPRCPGPPPTGPGGPPPAPGGPPHTPPPGR